MKRLLEIISLIALVFAALPASAAEGPVLEDVRFPAGKFFGLGSPFPVVVEIASPDGPFSGRVRIEASGLAWEKEIQIPACGKRSVFFQVIFTDSTGAFNLKTISDAGEKIFDTKKYHEELTGVSAARKMVCVIGESTGDLSTFFRQADALAVSFDYNSLPVDYRAYGQFLMVAITDARPGVLAGRELEALSQWIKHGGRLFLPNYSMTIESLDLERYFDITYYGKFLKAGRWGLGYVFFPGGDLDFRELDAQGRASMMKAMFTRMETSGSAYEIPGPVAAVDRGAADFFEKPERFPERRAWWKVLLWAQAAFMVLLFLWKKKARLPAAVAAVAVSVLVILMLPPESLYTVESVSITYSRPGTREAVKVSFAGVGRISALPDSKPCETLSLGGGDTLIPVRSHYNDLMDFELLTASDNGFSVSGFGISNETPAVFMVSSRGENPGISMEPLEGGRLKVTNLSSSDLEDCFLTDFSGVCYLGGLKRGESREIFVKFAEDYKEILNSTALAGGRLSRLKSAVYKYLFERRPGKAGEPSFVAYSGENLSAGEEKRVRKVFSGEVYVIEIP